MDYLKHYAEQVAVISDDMRVGNLTMEEAAIRLQTVAVLAEDSAGVVGDPKYSERLKEMADKIYKVIEKMMPENRVVQ